MKLDYLTLGLIVLIGFTSCNKDENQTPEPITKANIIGSVNLYDESTTQIENSGMTIKLEGTEFSSTTDGQGDFTLTEVPFGSYTIVYEKSGFGTFKKFNLEHINTGSSTVVETPSLGQKSTTSVTNLTISSNANFPVIIGATTNPEGNQTNTRYIRFFFSIDPNVSHENYDSYLETFPANISPYNLNLSQASFDALDLTSGSTVYVKCYGESFWGNSYSDPDLNRDIFPNLNPTSAPAVSFVVP
ncbi:MAG: carboxypeptidase regulatory-like domain-containing protein [Marinilabiliales bacterium]|nr:MAG: carboxypeptidase regulatory-like domain-containing protein [Marinilabiliales bacterium]